MKKLFCTLLATVFCLSIISVPTGARAAQPELEKPVIMVARDSLGSTSGFQAMQGSLEDIIGIRMYMTHSNKDAKIIYTTNGSTPAAYSKYSEQWIREYDSPLYVTYDITYKAIACADGYEDSDVATFTFKLIKGKPNSWQLVKIGSSQKWIYFDENGEPEYYGWIKDKGKWYFFAWTYSLVTNGWYFCVDKWYYFDASGAMQVDWIKVGGKWYYLQPSGAMKTGWLMDNGKWYFLDDNGSMATGWLKRPEGWYYLLPNGKMATSGKEMGDIHQMFDANGLWTGVAG